MRWSPAVLLAAALLLAAPGPAAAARPVPKGWLGVSFGPEYVAAHARPSLSAELRRMKRSGVQHARFAAYWSQIQPYERMALVPPAERARFREIEGMPLDLRRLDRLVSAAARRRLPLMPVVLGAPTWATDDPNRPIDVPRDPATYARFVGALARRYGSAGTFWAEHPTLRRLPIRPWQIWNEVSNAHYWDASWRDAYPRLLRAAYDALKAADPRARVVMSGLNSGEAGSSWNVLDTLYRSLDDQSLGRPFDVVAAHIYTRRVPDAVRVVRETRDVMRRHGDATRPIRVTELAWPASKGRLRDGDGRPRQFFAETTNRGMAKRLTRGILALARQRAALRIAGVDWFQWASAYKGTDDAFRYSGLRRAARRRLEDMPAMKAFRRVAKRLRRGV